MIWASSTTGRERNKGLPLREKIKRVLLYKAGGFSVLTAGNRRRLQHVSHQPSPKRPDRFPSAPLLFPNQAAFPIEAPLLTGESFPYSLYHRTPGNKARFMKNHRGPSQTVRGEAACHGDWTNWCRYGTMSSSERTNSVHPIDGGNQSFSCTRTTKCRSVR